MTSRDQALALGTAIDALVVVAVTVLGALRVIPGEAIIGLLGTLIGARAMRNRGGGGDGSGGSSSSSFPPPEARPPAKLSARTVAEFSTVAALAGLILAFVLPHHHQGDA